MSLVESFGKIYDPLFTERHSSGALHKQITRLSKESSSYRRWFRNRRYRDASEKKSWSEDVARYHEEYPEAEGAPRAYNMIFRDHSTAIDPDCEAEINSQTVHFSKFGANDSHIHISGHHIHKKDVKYSPATKIYTFQSKINHPHPENAEKEHQSQVHGYINFASAKPFGALTVNTRAFSFDLEPSVIQYDVQVSANAGATWISAGNKLSWDKDSTAWKSATWETTLGFGSMTKSDHVVPVPTYRIENYFEDRTSPKPYARMDLLFANYSSDYTCTLIPTPNNMGSIMETTIMEAGEDTIPDAPDGRANSPVKSVFPKTWVIEYNDMTTEFWGAYKDVDNNVYAVHGTSRKNPFSFFSLLTAAKLPEGVKDTSAVLGNSGIERLHTNGATDAGNESFAIRAMDVSATLDATGLMGLTPMIPDATRPSGYKDEVADLAMRDFHDIVLYYMDSDLRNTFIQTTPVVLTAKVQEIADNDAAANSVFYKKLQVPYIITALAASTDPDAAHLNIMRAQAQLQSIPTNDPVYKSHSILLYAARFKEKHSEIQKYLDNQETQNYDAEIDALASFMEKSLSEQTKDVSVGNKNFTSDYDKLVKDIHSLRDWAKNNNLYWAFAFLHTVQQTTLVNWYSQYHSSFSSSILGMQLKAFNAIFGMLENNALNSDGLNFMQTFNNMVQLFQMTSIIPTLIDPDGVSTELDDLVKESLQQFYNNFKDYVSTDPKLQEELRKTANAANDLFNNDTERRNLILPLREASSNLGAAANWLNVTTMWEKTVMSGTAWKIGKVTAYSLKAIQFCAAGGLLVMGFIPSIREKMTLAEKVSWGITVAGFAAAIAIKIAQGVMRYKGLWSQMPRMGKMFKCLIKGGDIIDLMPEAANRYQSAVARYFTRTAKQTIALAEEDKLIPRANAIRALDNIGPEGMEEAIFPMWQKLLGRNMGELIGTVVGVVLAIVNVVMTTINMLKETDNLMIASDAMMWMSGVIQILTYAAGWIAVAAGAAAEGTFLASVLPAMELCAAWGGPVAIAFAVIGIIIWIVWYCLQDKRSPLQKFIDDHVKPAGLYVESAYAAPEYFQYIPPHDGNVSLVGLSISTPANSNGGLGGMFPFDLQMDKTSFLRVSPTSTGANLDQAETVDYSTNTVWSMSVNAEGKSVIETRISVSREHVDETTNAKSTVQVYETWCLASSDDNNSLIVRKSPLRPAPERKDDTQVEKDRYKTDLDKYDADMKHVYWTMSVYNPSLDQTDKKNTKIKSATASLTQGEKTLVARYSGTQGSGHRIKCHLEKLELAKTSDYQGLMGNFIAVNAFWLGLFQIKTEPLKASPFTYGHPTWVLFTDQKEERNPPRFHPPYSSSTGMTWSVSPALDSTMFELLGPNAIFTKDEGVIRCKKGVTLTVMAQTEYTVSCAWIDNGVQKSIETSKLSIEVKVPVPPVKKGHHAAGA